jgi:membrane protein DedA with SNARE-associated domain
MRKKILKHIVQIVMNLLIALTILLWLLALFKPDLIKEWIEWIRTLVEWLGNWNYLIVFISSLIESFPVLWVVVPGQNILLIVGWFFAKLNINTLYYVVIITSVWAIIWNFIGFYLWKIYWDSFFKKYGLWFWIWETELKYLEKWIEKWGPWGITFWKFHWLTRAFLPFIAGSMWMKSKTFMFYNVLGSIIRSIVMIILWVLFAEHYEKVIDNAWKIMLAIMILTWLYIWKYKKKEFNKYMKEKNEEMDRKFGVKK